MNTRVLRMFLFAQLSTVLVLLGGCETMPQGIRTGAHRYGRAHPGEPPGDYFIGRRYFKPDYKFWGYVRKPGQPWTTAQLVMLNEKFKLAPIASS